MGGETAKGYLRESFEDAFNRYLSPEGPSQTVTASQSNKLNDLDENQSVTSKPSVTVSNQAKALKSLNCYSVTDAPAENGPPCEDFAEQGGSREKSSGDSGEHLLWRDRGDCTKNGGSIAKNAGWGGRV